MGVRKSLTFRLNRRRTTFIKSFLFNFQFGGLGPSYGFFLIIHTLFHAWCQQRYKMNSNDIKKAKTGMFHKNVSNVGQNDRLLWPIIRYILESR